MNSRDSVMSPVLMMNNCNDKISTHALPTVYAADHDGKWTGKFPIIYLALKLATVWPGYGAGFSTQPIDISNYPVKREGIDPDMPWIECRSRPLKPYLNVKREANGDYHVGFIYGNLGAVYATITSNGQVIQGPIS